LLHLEKALTRADELQRKGDVETAVQTLARAFRTTYVDRTRVLETKPLSPGCIEPEDPTLAASLRPELSKDPAPPRTEEPTVQPKAHATASAPSSVTPGATPPADVQGSEAKGDRQNPWPSSSSHEAHTHGDLPTATTPTDTPTTSAPSHSALDTDKRQRVEDTGRPSPTARTVRTRVLPAGFWFKGELQRELHAFLAAPAPPPPPVVSTAKPTTGDITFDAATRAASAASSSSAPANPLLPQLLPAATSPPPPLPPCLCLPAADDKPRPFANLGSSCFINASLTALFGPAPLRHALMDVFITAEDRLRKTLWPTAVSLTGMTTELLRNRRHSTHEERLAVTLVTSLRAPAHDERLPRGAAVVPRLLTNLFYRTRQEDAHEFLQALLEAEHAPRLHALCQGLDTPVLRCRDCGWSRDAAPELFTWLALPLLDKKAARLDSVQRALDTFLEPEDLNDPDYEWRCDTPGCGSSRLPTKQHTLTRTPQVLCVQLVRWQAAGDHDALLHTVRCEENLECQGLLYVLRSVVCHMGSSPRNGHYTSRLHYPSAGGDWWYYNNSERRAVRPGEVETTATVMGSVERSYLAFYERSAD